MELKRLSVNEPREVVDVEAVVVLIFPVGSVELNGSDSDDEIEEVTEDKEEFIVVEEVVLAFEELPRADESFKARSGFLRSLIKISLCSGGKLIKVFMVFRFGI